MIMRRLDRERTLPNTTKIKWNKDKLPSTCILQDRCHQWNFIGAIFDAKQNKKQLGTLLKIWIAGELNFKFIFSDEM